MSIPVIPTTAMMPGPGHEFDTLHAASLLLVGKKYDTSGSYETEMLDYFDVKAKQSFNCVGGGVCTSNFSSIKRFKNNEVNKLTTLSSSYTTNIMSQTEQKQQEQQQHTIVSDLLGPVDESRWRIHGRTKRTQILEDDKNKGGRDFSLSFDCSVQRYFSVAHMALEQFHQLYQKLSNKTATKAEVNEHLEEVYVMGHRIICFLTECLPRHPGLNQAPEMKQKTRRELVLLRKCIDDVALQIDENICNQFVDDDDMFMDRLIAETMDDDDDDSSTITDDGTMSDDERDGLLVGNKNCAAIKIVRFEDWVPFPNTKLKNARKLAGSPTSETVGTTGTESLEPIDTSYMGCLSPSNNHQNEGISNNNTTNTTIESVHLLEQILLEDSDDDFEIDHFQVDDDENDVLSLASSSSSSASSRNQYTTLKRVPLDFLDKISREEVLYENDSEAADSWANGGKSITTDDDKGNVGGRHHNIKLSLGSSLGVTPTCDPARIAFRDLMNRISYESILQRKDLGEDTSDDLEIDSSDFLSQSSTTCSFKKEAIIKAEMKPSFEPSMVDESSTKFIGTSHESVKATNIESDNNNARRERGHIQHSPLTSYISSLSSSSSSLASLSKKTGSQTSAFSSFSRQQIQQQQQQENHLPQTQQVPSGKGNTNKSKTLVHRQAHPIEKSAESFLEQDDWISFDNFATTSCYFPSAVQ